MQHRWLTILAMISRRSLTLLALPVVVLLTGGWGQRAHITANRMAVDALPADGPVFLKEYREQIGAAGPIPDSWRGNTEPYSKLVEDANHGWFREQFLFMKEIPRSRYEFVIRLYDEQLRIKDKQPELARLMNVRWTGTLPYAAMESYDHMKSAMRLYRRAKDAKQDTKWLEQQIAFHMAQLGHYTADGAQPLHVTIHHDGWVGPNPKGFTTDPRVHGRCETQYVDLIQLVEADLKPFVPEAKRLDDPFVAVIDHLDQAFSRVEETYELDKAGAFTDKQNKAAREWVYSQLGHAATLLRDLTYTAWLESGIAPPVVTSIANSPNNPDNPNNLILPKNPNYRMEIGSAPPGPNVRAKKY